MGETSGIEWTDATWTPIRARRALPDGERLGWHCEHASEGCRNCCAEAMNRRLGTGLDFKPGHRGDVEIFLDEALLAAPLRWRRGRKIFVCSMTDLFADFVPDWMIDRMFAVMALCPQHQFQVLTKRADRMRAYLSRFEDSGWFGNLLDLMDETGAAFGGGSGQFSRWPLPNVWLGVSVEDQRAADARIPHLLATPAAVRFLSCEPLLGPLELSALPVDDRPLLSCDSLHGVASCGPYSVDCPKIDQVIVGGESGRAARPMHPDWARSLRDQCAAAGVPFFFKQWGEWLPYDQRGARQFRNSVAREGTGPFWRVGKKTAGRLLDGVLHEGMPA